MKRFSKMSVLITILAIAGTMIATPKDFIVKAEAPQGVISIAFDDEYQNQYLYAFPLLEQYGLVGTFYIRTDNIGGAGYMTISQLQNLENAGNEIGSHSHTHVTFTSLSEAEIRYECEQSKQTLETNGFSVTNFAYPNGPTNATVDSIVSQYYRSGRTAYSAPFVMEVPNSQFRVAGYSAETADSTALSLLKGMVDQVQTSKGWAIIFFHNIIPNAYNQQYTTSAEDFASFLNYTVTKGVQTLTVNQVLDSLPLLTSANFGTVTPQNGLYNLGQTVNIQAFSPQTGAGERFIWLGWESSGSGGYTGTNNPASITMNNPITQRALWKREFRLSVSSETGSTSPSGESWYESGALVNIDATAPNAEDGERYVWNGWIGTGSGSYSGSEKSISITINGPITQTTSWTHQYYINVSSTFGVTSGSGWYNSGAIAYASIDSSIANATSDVRQVLTGWSKDASGAESTSDPIAVNSPKSAIASWKKQYLFIFDQTGLSEDANASVFVNSENHNLPYSVWVDEGDSLDFAYPEQISDGAAKTYFLRFPLSQTSIVADSPTNMTAQYETRLNTTFLALIITSIVLVFLFAFVLWWVKKHRRPRDA